MSTAQLGLKVENEIVSSSTYTIGSCYRVTTLGVPENEMFPEEWKLKIENTISKKTIYKSDKTYSSQRSAAIAALVILKTNETED